MHRQALYVAWRLDATDHRGRTDAYYRGEPWVIRELAARLDFYSEMWPLPEYDLQRAIMPVRAPRDEDI